MKWIRPWQLSDAPDLALAINDPAIQNNLRDGIPYPYTKEDALNFLNAALSAPRDSQYTWAIQNEEGRAVGSIGIFRKENIHSRTGELGYFLAKPYWGKGMATAAVKEACDFVFSSTDLLRVFAEPFAQNTASRRVLEKAGFVQEGILRQNAVKDGVVLDMALYALLKEEVE